MSESYDLGLKEKEYIGNDKHKSKICYPQLRIGSSYNKDSKINIPYLNAVDIGKDGEAKIVFTLNSVSKGDGNEYILEVKSISFEEIDNKRERIEDIVKTMKGESK